MYFLEHVFSQETVIEGVSDHWPRFILSMSVGAHSSSSIRLVYFLCSITYRIGENASRLTFTYTTIVERVWQISWESQWRDRFLSREVSLFKAKLQNSFLIVMHILSFLYKYYLYSVTQNIRAITNNLRKWGTDGLLNLKTGAIGTKWTRGACVWV